MLSSTKPHKEAPCPGKLIRRSRALFDAVVLLHSDRFPCFNRHDLAFVLHPNVGGGRVKDDVPVGAGTQLAAGVQVVHNLDICRVPNILLAAHFLAEGADDLPVVMLLKLVAMSPQVEQLQPEWQFPRKEAVAQLVQLRVIVMASWVEAQPFVGNLKVVGADDSAGISNAAGAQGVDGFVAVCAVRVRKAADDFAKQLFQIIAVSKNLIGNARRGNRGQRRMGQRVGCDFVAAAA